MDKSLYEILGCQPDDSLETIKRKYRARARRCHPDRHPGKADEFKALSQAFEVLSNPQRRADYDRSGNHAARPDPRAAALTALSQVLLGIVKSDLRCGRNPSRRQLAGDLRQALESLIGAAEKELAELRRSRETLADVGDRFEGPDGESNLLAAIARAPLGDFCREIARVEERLETLKEAWAIAKKHKFRTDDVQKPAQTRDQIRVMFTSTG